jgi:hypothetical protein
VIADLLGKDTGPLVRAQRAAFAELLDGLSTPPPRSDVVATWRHHSAAAVAGFLAALDGS